MFADTIVFIALLSLFDYDLMSALVALEFV